jgi:hypothetical protein
MFPHSFQFSSSTRSPLIPWLLVGLMVLALAPATASAMPGRGQEPQPVTQDLRSPDQVSPAAKQFIGGPRMSLNTPAAVDVSKYVDTTTKVYGTPGPAYGTHGPLPTTGALPTTQVQSPSSGDDVDVWLIVGIGAALLAACAAGIGVAGRTKIRTVRHA